MQTHQDIWFSVSDEEEHIYFRAFHKPNPILDFIPWPIRVPGIVFADGSQITSSAGEIGFPGGPNGSLQYNNNGDFGGANIFYNSATGQIGINTDNPSAQLTVNGEIQVSSRTPGGVGSGFGVTIGYDTSTHYGGIENFNYDTNQYEPLYVNGSVLFLNYPGTSPVIPGYVGINNPNPEYYLDVAGDINIDDPGGANGYAFRVNGVPIGGGGSQTPWLSDIDADGFELNNAASINNLQILRGGLGQLTIQAQGITITDNSSSIQFNLGAGVGGITLATGYGDIIIYRPSSGNVQMRNLPTSGSGLPSGALWNNGGVLNIA